MSLTVGLKHVEGLEGHADRFVKIIFRGFVKTSNTIKSRDVAYFGQQFEWPVGRRIDENDTLQIRVYNRGSIGRNKLLGSLIINLQQLLVKNTLSVNDHIIDPTNAILRTTIAFEIEFMSPSAAIGSLKEDTFHYPVANLSKVTRKKKSRFSFRPGLDSDAESEVSISDAQSLLLAADERWHEEDDVESEKAEDEDLVLKGSTGLAAVLDPTILKRDDWQVCVTIIEARNLLGPNINPQIYVQIGDQLQKTDIAMSSNNPFYNQYMCFEFKMSHYELMDQVICITAQGKMEKIIINRVLPGKLIGEFRMDIRTVLNQPDHQFYHKWAMLLHPKDILAGAKGYVKCDIAVMAKGETLKLKPSKQSALEQEDIEANLLLPEHIQGEKHSMAQIAVKIYRAEDLPKMDTDLMATIKKAITGEARPMVDPYVKVTFCGHTAKTHSKSNTYKPEWNEEIVFTELFPTLCHTIRISVYDWDALHDNCIATHCIDIDKIMNNSKVQGVGYPPTFGPSWVNLYGAPRNFGFENLFTINDEMNLMLGEGVAYRGRLLMAIKTKMVTDSCGHVAGARANHSHAVSELVAGKKDDFLLIGILYEASAISKEYGKKGKAVSYEISIGTYGNKLDGIFPGDDDYPDDEDLKPKKKNDTSNEKPVVDSMWCNSMTPGLVPITTDHEYYHLPIYDVKPLLYVRCAFEDQRLRMYLANIMDCVRYLFEKCVNEIQEILDKEYSGAENRLAEHLAKIKEQTEKSLKGVRSCRGTAGKTMLDKQRQLSYKLCLKKIMAKLDRMENDITAENVPQRLKDLRLMSNILKDISSEPQHGLPDVFIWMIMDGKRIAFCRIASRDIMYSVVSEERGKDCARLSTLFMRKPGRKGAGDEGWSLQGKLKMYLWLGQTKEMKSYRQYIPEGYDPIVFEGTAKKPPNELCYKETSYFQFRCHMFMARNLIGSEKSGLSDAFCRILLNDQVITTRVLPQTLSPVWDETLIVNVMKFCFNKTIIKNNAPVIVVEFFDDHLVNITPNSRFEFIGRCFCKPIVTLHVDDYAFPKLEWWDIFRGQTPAGQLLAAFELLELLDGEIANDVPSVDKLHESTMIEQIQYDLDDVKRPRGLLLVPLEVRPKLHNFRFEIRIWGVRELKKIMLQKVDRPRIIVMFGTQRIQSTELKSCKDKPNFSEYRYIDMKLPVEKFYWPPIMIQCEDCREFGRSILVGNHLIYTPQKYFWKPEMDEEDGIMDSECGFDLKFDDNGNIKEVDDEAPDPFDLSAYMNPENDNAKADNIDGSVNNSDMNKEGGIDNPGMVMMDEFNIPDCWKPKPVEYDGIGDGGEQDGPGGPGGSVPFDARKIIPKEEVEEIDWWSRYFATINDIENNCESSSDEDSDPFDQIEIENESEADKNDDIVELPDSDEEDRKKGKRRKKKKKPQKKKKKKKKKSLKQTLAILRGDGLKAYKLEKDDLNYTTDIKDDGWIQRITFYNNPLEEVKDFDFNDFNDTFPLYKGKQSKEDASQELRITGFVKAKLRIYDIDEDEFGDDSIPDDELKLYQTIHKDHSINMLVRVYVIRAIDLHPRDLDGKADPYIIAKLGERVVNDSKEYIPKQLNPTFGKVFELEAQFPQESTLVVQVMDWDRLLQDELIGETRIDLENRYHTKHRAMCGIPNQYDSHGYNKWRDQLLPTVLVDRLCDTWGVEKPTYYVMEKKVVIKNKRGEEKTFYADVKIVDESGEETQSNEPLALEILKKWRRIAGFKLIPEHVEVRPLYLPDNPEIEQGRIELWVDMFPKDIGTPAAAVNIAPRIPLGYELRVIIWNAEQVILNDDSFLTGEKSSDIYFKGWMKGANIDMQQTDIHYKSLSGEGNFNWRFIFPFEYLKAEDKIIFKKRELPVYIDEEEIKAPCFFYLQVWDADLIGSDNYLGSIEFPLTKIPRGAKSVRSCGAHQLLKNNDIPCFSLFKNKNTRGYWPLMGPDPDDADEIAVNGKVDMELQLLTKEEAEQNEAGLGRDDPLGLPKPNRPETSFFSMLNPLKALHYLICTRLKPILIKLLIIILCAALLAFFIYAIPNYAAKKMMGA